MPHPNIVETEIDLEKIIRNAKVAAVVGMKDEKDAALPAYEIPKRVKETGIRVIPVNPKIGSALGEKAYPDLASVPDRFDMVNVFRRADALGPLADEILALPPNRRPKVVWIQTGIVNWEAAQKLAEAGIKVVMDRCLGVYASRYRHSH